MIARLLQALKPWPKHPIDRRYGIETSRRFHTARIRVGDRELDASNVGYVGSQPSVIRRALETLPDLDGATFFDLGCGKGRVLVVAATEFPFAHVVGIELSPPLAARAVRNLARVERRSRLSAKTEIVVGDATRPALPSEGLIVTFLYNSFRAPLVARMLDHLAAHIGVHPQCRLFLVYYNPVHAAVIDKDARFARYHAQAYRLEADESASSPWKGQGFDSLVIWQVKGTTMTPPMADADRAVDVLREDLVAEVKMAPAD